VSEPAAPLLEHWHEFYVLAGTGAAALIALLFVAASIGVGVVSTESSGPTRTYMSPVAAHFTSVLYVSLITLVPSHSRASLAGLIGLGGLAGVAYSVFIVWRLMTAITPDLPDRLGYGAVPLVSYVGMCVAALLFAAGSHWGTDVLSAAIVLLMIVNIRNAWDLTMTMARRQAERR
jgi:hypothetical protein